MRYRGVLLALGLGLAAGCGHPVAKYEGPTVKEFSGKLVKNGTPVSFASDTVVLKVFHEKGESFGIPVQHDGSFKIGWMPTGKYSCFLTREPAAAGRKGGTVPNQYTLPPGALEIVDGKTDYTIELGKGYKA